MPRLPRFNVPNFAHHVIQRGHNRGAVFFEAFDYLLFMGLLDKACRRYQVELHAYVLMPDHVHLLATPRVRDGLSRAIQMLSSSYVRAINRKYSRTGTLWEGRYRSTVVDDQDFVLLCHRYIETNPVRIGITGSAAAWPYSSVHAHAQGEHDPLLFDHPAYLGLGPVRDERIASYARLVEAPIPPDMQDALWQGTNHGWAVGSPSFKKRLESASERRTEPIPRGGRRAGAGRPRKRDVGPTDRGAVSGDPDGGSR